MPSSVRRKSHCVYNGEKQKLGMLKTVIRVHPHSSVVQKAKTEMLKTEMLKWGARPPRASLVAPSRPASWSALAERSGDSALAWPAKCIGLIRKRRRAPLAATVQNDSRVV
jgi:hypothetical protein